MLLAARAFAVQLGNLVATVSRVAAATDCTDKATYPGGCGNAASGTACKTTAYQAFLKFVVKADLLAVWIFWIVG